MSKRPSLFSAAAAPAARQAPLPAASIGEEAPPAPVALGKARPASRQGKKVLSLFVEPEAWRQLRNMALEEDTTTQALGVEALNLLFAARGKGRLA